MNRPRHWEVTGDVLTLTTRDDRGAPMSISRWKKKPVGASRTKFKDCKTWKFKTHEFPEALRSFELSGW